jgi:cytochrome c553
LVDQRLRPRCRIVLKFIAGTAPPVGHAAGRINSASSRCAASAWKRAASRQLADHLQPHRGDYNAFKLGSLRSLCADCHNRLDSANNAPRYPVREDGTPSDPSHPWNTDS